MNESIKNLLERRSIRAYKKELVPKETLDTILEAGKYSPSGMGRIRMSLQFSSLLRRYFSFSLRFADTFRDSSSFFNNFPPRFIPVHRFRCTRQICCQSAIFLNSLIHTWMRKKREASRLS